MIPNSHLMLINEDIACKDRFNDKVSFYEQYVINSNIHDTLSNLSDDLNRYEIKIKKKFPNKIGKRGFMVDNIIKKLKGNFLKYILNVFHNFGYKIKKLPQSYVTNVSIKMNQQFIEKPISYLFEYYFIDIPKEHSFNLLFTFQIKDTSFSQRTQDRNKEINKNTTIKNKNNNESNKEDFSRNENFYSEKKCLKKILYEYTFEYVFNNIFLKSDYFAKIIEEFKKDSRFSEEYIDKFIKLSEVCMKRLKG